MLTRLSNGYLLLAGMINGISTGIGIPYNDQELADIGK
jgi:hypothetical protein